MRTFDDATEAYMARLLDEAPPLDHEQAALIVRTFARRAGRSRVTSSTPAADAA